MQKITVIGGSTRDIYFVSKEFNVKEDTLHLVWGEKMVVKNLYASVGGGGANAAVGFARLGLNSSLVSQVGDDSFGRRIKHTLQDENVDLKLFKICPDKRTSTSALLTIPNHDHTIVMYRGSNDDLQLSSEEKDVLLDTEWLYITDLAGESKTLVEQLAKEARTRNTKVAFIPGQNQLDRGIEALQHILTNTNIFILNLWEAAQLFNTRIECSPQHIEDCNKFEPTVADFLNRFADIGVETCVITKDICGVSAYHKKSSYSVPAPKTTVVDTTGAGDAFACGFVGTLAKGEDIHKALQVGSKNAGSVIANYGAQTGLILNE